MAVIGRLIAQDRGIQPTALVAPNKCPNMGCVNGIQKLPRQYS
jgi:hypothetical protein